VRAIESRRGLLKLQEGDKSSGDARAHDDLAFCLALLVDMAGDALGRVGLPEMSACYRYLSPVFSAEVGGAARI
jgi:hypothetical protein